MHALNLFLLTRTDDEAAFSGLERMLSGRHAAKRFSRHEIASLRALTDALAEAAGSPGALLPLLEGFCFSYTIDHISKEFDLIKLAPDRSLVLNVELKSEAVTEERIRHQLEQNRYYLSHISRGILSYTYVSETDTLYQLNDHGFFSRVGMEELLGQLRRPALQGSIEGELEQYFRSSDYLISPVSEPDRFLKGKYFLTNQQAQFKQEILDLLTVKKTPLPPFISLTGSAGTGKTLLLLDLGMDLSKRRSVLFLHGGLLRDGHRRMDALLHNIRFLSSEDPEADRLLRGDELKDTACILCDEANRLDPGQINLLAQTSRRLRIPCVLAHDPHRLLRTRLELAHAEALLDAHTTTRFELSGNIRINQPVYTFLRLMFNRKQTIPQQTDFSCIDVLYASDAAEAEEVAAWYTGLGYTRLSLPESDETGVDGRSLGGCDTGGADLVGLEYDKVLILLDERFYYDEEQHLCAAQAPASSGSLLYEGLTRTRERLCLVVVNNPALFASLLVLRAEG